MNENVSSASMAPPGSEAGKLDGFLDFEVEKRLFWPPAILMVLLLAIGIVNRELFMTGADFLLKATIEYFGWMYLLFVFVFLVFVIGIAFSSAGDIRLGGKDAKPTLSYWNWWAIALCAGIGVGIIFWGVAEPLYHYYGPPNLLGADP